ncbi:DEAD/DEAH box helicase family protein [Streptomyces sp. NPDC002306]
MNRHPGGLSAADLHADYRSDRCDIVHDFYVPALGAATSYDRAVGYFSASVLAVLGQGLEEFAARGGTMRIVASPQLTADDVAQIHAGYELRAVLQQAAVRDMEQAAQDPRAASGLGKLGLLIADSRLDIKLAYISTHDRIGIYHEKIGIFHDGHDLVAFKGSANETMPALVGNFESIEVFRTWEPGDRDRAVRISQDFDDLWDDRTPLLRVLDFTAGAHTVIQRCAPSTTDETTHIPPLDGALITLPRPDSAGRLAIPGELSVRDYQKQAVQAWFEAGGRGILRMATGTGKTLTALAAAAQLTRVLQKHDQPLLTLVIAPYQHLVDQWCKDIAWFGVQPIRAYESTSSWFGKASSLLDALALGSAQGGVIVTTNATFAAGPLQSILARHRGRLLIIADECHNLGAKRLREKLPASAAYRLGLSATPERWFDDRGTAALAEYFGDVVFEMGIGDAIRAGALCRYTYTPVLVELDDEETYLYAEVTEKIAKLIAADGGLSSDTDDDSPLGQLLRRRSNILGHARAKLPALRREITARRNDWYQLLYCAEGRHPLAYEDGDPNEPTQLQQALAMVGTELRMPAAPYTAETKRPERQQLLRQFATGSQLQVLLSMKCLDEGVDVPAARTAYLLASSSNPRQFIQRRGRVLRKAPGKERADIVDFIVVPPSDASDLHRETERRMVARELARVTEFARLADNEAHTLDILRPLRLRYGLLDT